MQPDWSENLKKKLRELPDKPGVYLMRNRQGRIIYVGKAASLRKRVQSYFRQSTARRADPKTSGLLRSIWDLDVMVVRTEAEATLTEGRLIKQYRPHFNSLFKDDKRFLLLRVNLHDEYPRFDACRLQKEDGATYFGPYASSAAARVALDFIDRRYGLRRCLPAAPGTEEHKHCLNDILRYCSAPCIGKVSAAEYHARAEEACAFLRGERKDVLEEVKQAMTKAAAGQDFEKAAALRDSYLLLCKAIRENAIPHTPPAVKIEDALAGVAQLQTELALPRPPQVIEAYDISNISGTLAVGSLVCAVDGMPQKNRYRRFRIRTVEGSDDPRMMAEMIRRRFEALREARAEPPDLVLVDGGIAQLRAAHAEMELLGYGNVPVAGLAKQNEEIYYEPSVVPLPATVVRESDMSSSVGSSSDSGLQTNTHNPTPFLSSHHENPYPPLAPRPPSLSTTHHPQPNTSPSRASPAPAPLRLPLDSPALKVLQRIRDEAHRFALDYHHRLRQVKIKESILDEIDGVGGKRKELLLKTFGSIFRLARASAAEIAAVPGVGAVLARAICDRLRPEEAGAQTGNAEPTKS